MPDKTNINEKIARLMTGNLEPKERDELQSWIEQRPENKAHFGHLVNIWQVSKPELNPDQIDTRKALNRVTKTTMHSRKGAQKLISWWQQTAAILILPLMALLAWFYFQNPVTRMKVAYQEVVSPLGMRSRITLPDGSEVWLNSGSRLRYPVPFTNKAREVALAGEAFFEVHSDSQHPFAVTAGIMTIEATGTSFNVEAFADDTIAAVTLLEGVVNVSLKGGGSEVMKPNNRLVLNLKRNQYDLKPANAQLWCLWKDGILAIRDEPLESVFKRLGRTFNVDITVSDKSVGRQLYRATFEDESFEEILSLLKLSAPIQYIRHPRVKLGSNEFSKERIEVISSR